MTKSKTYNIDLISPLNCINEENVKRCKVTTDHGETIFLSGHSDYLSSFTASTIEIVKNNSSVTIYTGYRGLVSFSCSSNKLSITCMGFDSNPIKRIEDREKILQSVNKSDLSKYTLKLLDNEKLALEKLETVK